jgi:hypothetical protein
MRKGDRIPRKKPDMILAVCILTVNRPERGVERMAHMSSFSPSTSRKLPNQPLESVKWNALEIVT